jgi:hypothetical protein
MIATSHRRPEEDEGGELAVDLAHSLTKRAYKL